MQVVKCSTLASFDPAGDKVNRSFFFQEEYLLRSGYASRVGVKVDSMKYFLALGKLFDKFSMCSP